MSEPPFETVTHPTQSPQHDTIGPIAGSIIIVMVLVIGAMYFWGAHLNQSAVLTDQSAAASTAAAGLTTSQ